MKMRWHKKFSRTLRQRWRNKVLANYGVAVLADTRNGILAVEAGDFNVGRQLLEKGEYDWEEILWLRSLLKPESSNVLVVGTHVGALVVPIAKSCRQVQAYEADSKNYTFLQYNLSLNKCDNVEAENKAVGDSEKIVSIQRNDLNTGNTAVSQSRNATEQVQMVRLDDVVRFDCIDLIIMDIEGYELHAIKGAEQLLERTENLYIEYAPQQLKSFGSNPGDLIAMLFAKFDYMSVSENGDTMTCRKSDGMAWLDQLDRQYGQKGYLRNLLFSKQQPV